MLKCAKDFSPNDAMAAMAKNQDITQKNKQIQATINQYICVFSELCVGAIWKNIRLQPLEKPVDFSFQLLVFKGDLLY